MTAAPVIGAITDGGAGMRAQAEGLAQRIAELSGGTVVSGSAATGIIGKVAPGWAAAGGLYRLDLERAEALTLALGCGSATHAALRAIKRKQRIFTVCIQRPAGSGDAYDAIVAPSHDYTAAEADNADARIILTLGAVGRVNGDLLARHAETAARRFAAYPPPYIGVLIGGDNRAYSLAADLTPSLQRVAAASGATLLITPSRRSCPALLGRLHETLGGRHFIWDGSGDNPYTDILAAAAGFCVTADSVNMLSEAGAGGRGIYILPLNRKRGWRAARAAEKFAAFHRALIARGNARWFDGDWQFFDAPPLDETTGAARRVWDLYQRTAVSA